MIWCDITRNCMCKGEKPLAENEGAPRVKWMREVGCRVVFTPLARYLKTNMPVFSYFILQKNSLTGPFKLVLFESSVLFLSHADHPHHPISTATLALEIHNRRPRCSPGDKGIVWGTKFPCDAVAFSGYKRYPSQRINFHGYDALYLVPCVRRMLLLLLTSNYEPF